MKADIVMRFLLIIGCCLSIVSCAGQNTRYRPADGVILSPQVDSTVAVLGVVGASKPLRGFQQRALANDLEAMIRTFHPRMAIYPHEHLRIDIERPGSQTGQSNAGVHALLLNRYRVNGTLNGEDLNLLRSAAGAVRYFVIARIDEDKTTKYEPYASPVRNRRGEVLLDQRRMTLLHERSVKVSATTVDLLDGGVVWQNQYISKPVAKREYTEYTGSSFSGSVAAMLANSFVNGRSSTAHPDAPRSVQAIRETFKKIAREFAPR